MTDGAKKEASNTSTEKASSRKTRESIDEWNRVLRDMSCDEDSDDERVAGIDNVDVVALQKHAKRVIERVAKIVPAGAVPPDVADAHEKALNA